MKVTVHTIDGQTYRFLGRPPNGDLCSTCEANKTTDQVYNNCFILWELNADRVKNAYGSSSCAGIGIWKRDTPEVLAEWTAQRLTGEDG